MEPSLEDGESGGRISDEDVGIGDVKEGGESSNEEMGKTPRDVSPSAFLKTELRDFLAR